MPSVSMPAEFFRGELRLYDCWRSALVRELLQNSLDAKATRIDVSFTDITVDGAPRGRLVFSDDGVGMNRRVLEDVFFALGRTTKTGPDTVGGFGRARILVCFAQHSYQIRTQDLLVTGRGGDYDITETDPGQFVAGAQFTLDLVDDDTASVERELRRLLDRCDLPVPVFVDGQLAKAASRPGRARRVLRDENNSPWASVHTSPSAYARLVVRVAGLEMFTRWIGGPENVVVELRSSRSREVLAASRDSLVAPFSHDLDRFIADLSQNRRRALTPPAKPMRMSVYGGGVLVSAPKTQKTSATSTRDGSGAGSSAGSSPAPGSAPAAGPVGPAVDVQTTRIGTTRPARVVSGSVPAAAYAPAPAAAADRPGVGGADLGFDLYLLADAADARVRKLAREWNPVGWPATGGRRRALALTWRAAVQVCLDALLEVRPDLGALAWTVGWTFDDGVVASHTTAGQVHVFSLNPTRSGTRIGYKTSDRADRARLLAAAAHEVCHVVGSAHDESFAGLLTEVFGTLDQRAAAAELAAAARS